MSKYDCLNARTELEQKIANDLNGALEKRGFCVKHNGTTTSCAPGNKPDIEVWGHRTHICVEVSKTKRSQSDREYLAIKDHLKKIKEENQTKKCFLLYISPETHYRLFNAIKEHNFINMGKTDLKILSVNFETFELFMSKLTFSPKEQYTKNDIMGLFADMQKLGDDEMVTKHFYTKLFNSDQALKRKIEEREEVKHQKVVKELIMGFKNLEDDLRKHRIAMAGDAIKNVIYLVFVKLYEEKSEGDGISKNRFTLKTFAEYQENVHDNKKAIHELFDNIKEDSEVKDAQLLTERDILSAKLTDDFVIEHFIKKFEKYQFYSPRIDGLGAAYEVLGQLSGKDVKVGQFFTPHNIVKFMAKMTELSPQDVVYDPACGTARFLTTAMEEEIELASKERGKRNTIQEIKENNFHGTDDDPSVAKLAKMNMFIHGDGKTNIYSKDGLLNEDLNSKIDVILTNPPLGNVSYRLPMYDKSFFDKMPILPRKNVTEETLTKTKKEFEKAKNEIELLNKAAQSQKAKRKALQIKAIKNKIVKLEAKKRNGREDIEVTGNELKGGALFVNRCLHYLKDTRDHNKPREWRGGRLLIIIDEGVLNTIEYSNVRDFIKKHYYIKAIISLTPETFVPVSKTRTKTNILYLIKKEDPNVPQNEPIFFAHVSKVGLDTKKKICENHLFDGNKNVLGKFTEFREKIEQSYDGEEFDKKAFFQSFGKETDLTFDLNNLYIEENCLTSRNLDRRQPETNFLVIDFERLEDRLDMRYYLPVYYEILGKLEESKNVFQLGDEQNKLIEDIRTGKSPGVYQKKPGIRYLKVRHVTNEGISRDDEYVSNTFMTGNEDFLLKKGDVVLVTQGVGSIGKVDLYEWDEDCFFDPKITRIRTNPKKLNPEYLVFYLRSPFAQKLLERYTRGSTGQLMLNPQDLSTLSIPLLSDTSKQCMIAEELGNAEKQARILVSRAEDVRMEATKKAFSKMYKIE